MKREFFLLILLTFFPLPVISQQIVLDGERGTGNTRLYPDADGKSFWLFAPRGPLYVYDEEAIRVMMCRFDYSGRLLSERGFTDAGLNAILQLPNGDFVLGGATNTPDVYSTTLLCLDSLGNPKWGKIWEDGSFGILEFILRSDSVLLVCGGRNRSITFQEYTLEGELLKTTSLQLPGVFAKSIQELPGGDILITGSRYNFTSFNYDIQLLRIGADGTIRWKNEYAITDLGQRYDAAIASDGTIAILSIRESVNPVTDLVLTQVDGEGNVIRATLYKTRYSKSIAALDPKLIPVDDGFYLMWASSTDSLNGMLRVDMSGGIRWGRRYGDSLSTMGLSGDLILSPDGYVRSSLFFDTLYREPIPVVPTKPYIVIGREEEDVCDGFREDIVIDTSPLEVTMQEMTTPLVLQEEEVETLQLMEAYVLPVDPVTVRYVCGTSSVEEIPAVGEEFRGNRLLCHQGQKLVLPIAENSPVLRIRLYDLLGHLKKEYSRDELEILPDGFCQFSLPGSLNGYLHVVIEQKEGRKTCALMVEGE